MIAFLRLVDSLADLHLLRLFANQTMRFAVKRGLQGWPLALWQGPLIEVMNTLAYALQELSLIHI